VGPVAHAAGAAARFDAEIGIGITGIAGPGGGTEDKPVGTVCFSVCSRGGGRLTRRVRLPGGRHDVRDRSVTVAMHLLRRLLLGERDADRDGSPTDRAPEDGDGSPTDRAPADGDDH
jgi:nicotinamide-nucleotide amidase